MSLHNDQTRQNFAVAMKQIWKDWNKPGGSRRVRRRAEIGQAIAAMTAFMPTPVISHEDLGPNTMGSFSWPSWRLRIGANQTSSNSIRYEDFLELCGTIYHETRHSEQFFRVAQGLAAGTIAFPDQSASQKMNIHRQVHGLGSVQDRMKMFQQVSNNDAIQVTPKMLSELLSIPNNVATSAALNAKMKFTAFCGSARPAWFKRNTIALEVEEWMRECYKATLSGVGDWAQSDHASFEFYANQPTERDAHGIEDNVKERIEAAIGVDEDGNEDATRQSATFAHL